MRTKTPNKTEASKPRVVAYIDPRVERLLQYERFATGKTLSLIVEEALANQLKHRQHAVHAAG